MKSAADKSVTAWLDEQREAQQMITRCADCDWTHAGSFAEGKAAALAHRIELHPERPAKYVRPKLKKPPKAKPNERELAIARELGSRSRKLARQQARESNREQRARRRDHLISEPRFEAAAELRTNGCTIGQIAHLAWSRWGYRAETACARALRRRFRELGLDTTSPRGRGTRLELDPEQRMVALDVIERALIARREAA